MDWVEKYRPARLQDLVGNTTSLRQMAEWARTWTPASRPLLLYGKPGTGKTSSALALARDMGWEVVELNASDQRTKAVIERVAGNSSTTASLTGEGKKLIVIDEADHLHGTADRGGAKAIIDVLQRSRQPIILIVNDLYGIPPELKNRCDLVQFRALQARSIVPRLKFICMAEGIRCGESALGEIAESARGDVRAAINMLQASAIGKDLVEVHDIHSSQKDERSTIFDLITALFRGARDEDLLARSADIGDAPDSILQWLEGAIPLIPDPGARARAYRSLAKADVLLGLTYRRQYFLLWRYAQGLMILGVADAAGGRGIHGRIQPPARWQKMGQSRRQKALRSVLLKKLSGAMHMDQKTFRESYLTPVSLFIERNPKLYALELQLDTDELAYFTHNRDQASAIMKELSSKPKKKSVAPEEPAEKKEKRSAAQSSLFDGFSRT
ncbi:MAG: replication factor C large subunit [Methanomicrobiales archaeon]|nr:replication factor C large subunit [Methanomicrobiales archaeon]